MSVFLAATLTTFAIYCLIAFSRPGWGGDDRSGKAANLHVPRWLANTLIIVIGIAGIVGVVFATFRFLHTEYSPAFELFDALTGRNAVSLLFGAITGVLLGAFASRVFSRHPGDPIDTRDRIVIVLLVLFFVLGIGGEEAIRGWSRRVSKVSALGTEIDFFQPAKSTSRANLRGSASNTAVRLPSSSVAPASSYGLTFLSNLGLLIDRDRKYSIIAVKLSGGDAKMQQGRINEIDETLKQPIEFARLIIEPFAACLEELQTQTGDTEFVNDRLLGLVDELRLMIAPDRDDDEMPGRLTTAFFQQSDELARFAMRIAIGAEGSKDPGRRSQRADAIAASCNRLYFLLFDADCWRDRKDDVACWEAKKDALNANSLPKDWVWTHREEVRDFYGKLPNHAQSAATLLSMPQGVSAAKYVTQVISEFSKTDGYQSRPYISIVYASVMAQIGRSEAALVELDRWLQRTRPEVRSSWYAVRALSTIAILTEEWLRRPSTDVPTVLLEYHIKNNQKAAALMESILHIESSFRARHAKLPESLEKTGFHSRPQEHRNCQPSADEVDSFEMLQLAFTARVTTDLAIAHHALSHPSYPLLYSHDVASAVGGLLETDLSCTVVATDGAVAIDQWRAESLRLYALMKLRDAGATAEIRGKEAADDSLKLALDAAALAAEIIYPHAHEDRASISAAEASPSEKPNLFDRITPTQNMDTLEEITLLRSQLLDARKGLMNE